MQDVLCHTSLSRYTAFANKFDAAYFWAAGYGRRKLSGIRLGGLQPRLRFKCLVFRSAWLGGERWNARGRKCNLNEKLQNGNSRFIE